ncbi:hypothetical protein RGQ29_006430 [Quercus rubra]|uniref:Transcription factor MYC/MYB N-terminal domain-containing protein n=1 Tax=Quercus rubra TaxID=3512 RepID=A0AAN7E7Q1_QUERU|nr:hypothetical protein RGQ29_006430 [Quercus rubra]
MFRLYGFLMESIAPPTKSPPGSPISEDSISHSIFPANNSCSSGSALNETISQISHSISTIFPPTKSQTDQSSESRQGQFSGLQTMLCVPLENGIVELGSTELNSPKLIL